MPALLVVALVTLGLMIASVIAAFLAARPREDELSALRRSTYGEGSMAAVDAPASSRPPFDLEGLHARSEGNPHLVRSVITDFLDQAPGLTQRVRVALDLGDARELARCATALRKAASPLGAEPFLRSVDQLERAAASDITLAWRAADVFDRDLERLRTSLERARAELDAAPRP